MVLSRLPRPQTVLHLGILDLTVDVCSEFVAVKVVRRVKRYVEDALVEVGILDELCENALTFIDRVCVCVCGSCVGFALSFPRFFADRFFHILLFSTKLFVCVYTHTHTIAAQKLILQQCVANMKH